MEPLETTEIQLVGKDSQAGSSNTPITSNQSITSEPSAKDHPLVSPAVSTELVIVPGSNATSQGDLQKITEAPAKKNVQPEDVSDCENDQDMSNFENRYIRRSRLVADSLDLRRKKSGHRHMQSVAYSNLVEDRIIELEKNIRLLQGLPALSTTADEDAAKVIPSTKPTIHTLTWQEFGGKFKTDTKARREDWQHRPEIDPLQKSTIEILREEPRFSWNTNYDSMNSDSKATVHMQDTIAAQGQQELKVEPHRIRIRSKLLLLLLNETTECNTSFGRWKHSLVFLRPFKLLVTFHQRLHSHLDGMDRNGALSTSAVAVVSSDKALDKTASGTDEKLDTKSPEARAELRMLCTMIEEYLSPQVELRQTLGPKILSIKYSDLWIIFKPGYEVRTRSHDQIQVYRVLKVTGGRETLSYGNPPDGAASKKLKEEGYSQGSFVIECFYVHFDGARYGPVNETFQIRKFEGEKAITSLPIYPLICDPMESENRDKLMARGKKFAELSSSRTAPHRKYKGLTLDENQEQVDSEVIIDFQLAFTHNKKEKPVIGLENLVEDDYREVVESWKTCYICGDAGCCGNDLIHQDYEIDDKEREDFKSTKKQLFESFEDSDSLTEDHKMLLPPKAFGFVLRSRKWASFDISLITNPDYTTGWDQLVIPQGTKDSVLALVANHERPKTATPSKVDGILSAVDLVQGKGRGLIILLHGEPGVGKTSTAECVAAHTHRPLFPITCGDIGDKPETVEANLDRNFQLAHKWGCVLLLDEADIFLSMRNEEDIQRNAIVSVFLRTLEYYSGILFLTTNRVGKIDRAFKSRIHLSLYYPKLNRKSTIQIWQNNLDRMRMEFAKEQKSIQCDGPSILDFCKKHYNVLKAGEKYVVWNGRQIRNAFQTAIAMATYEAKKPGASGEPNLTVQHFKTVADSAKQFDRYLFSVSDGHNETDVAKMRYSRDDDFPEDESSGSESESSSDERRKRKARRTTSTNKKHRSKKHGLSHEEGEDSSDVVSGSEAESGSSSRKAKKRKKTHKE